MRRRVFSLTGPLPFSTLETVATDMFASRATSLIVTILLTGYWPISVERGKYVIVYIRGARAPLLARPPLPPSHRPIELSPCEIPAYRTLHYPGDWSAQRLPSGRPRLRPQSSRRSPERGRILLLRRLALHQHPATRPDHSCALGVRSLRADSVR